MTVTKFEGTYRVAYRLGAIALAQPAWDYETRRQHAELTCSYTEDREDALGTAKAMSDFMSELLERTATAPSNRSAQAASG